MLPIPCNASYIKEMSMDEVVTGKDYLSGKKITTLIISVCKICHRLAENK